MEKTKEHDSPYSEEDIDAMWYNPQELKEMRVNCAHDVVDIVRHCPPNDLKHALEACQSTAYDTQADVQDRLDMLGRVVGVAHLCCKAFAADRHERQKAVQAAVQRAQQRGRRSSTHHSHHHHHDVSSSSPDLCHDFLVCRASEQISLPCRRLALWLARAVVVEED